MGFVNLILSKLNVFSCASMKVVQARLNLRSKKMFMFMDSIHPIEGWIESNCPCRYFFSAKSLA